MKVNDLLIASQSEYGIAADNAFCFFFYDIFKLIEMYKP